MSQMAEEKELEEIPLEPQNGVSLEWFVRSSALAYILEDVEGENAREVAEVLAEKENATSEEIAKELGVKLGSVRSILESLYEAHTTDLQRSKDDETGWISFYWRLTPSKALNYLAEKKQSLLQEIKEELQSERESIFFTCKNRCTRVEFDRATELEFECPECGNKMYKVDNNDIIRNLEERAERLEGSFESRAQKRKSEAGGKI